MNLTTFSIFKNKEKKAGSNQPDYNISAKVGDKYANVGACWLKDSKNGDGKYFSCKISEKVTPAKETPVADVPVIGTDGQVIPF